MGKVNKAAAAGTGRAARGGEKIFRDKTVGRPIRVNMGRKRVIFSVTKQQFKAQGLAFAI